MSWVDIVLIALVVLFGTIGVFRGVQKSALSLGAFLISFIVAFFLANTVAEAFLNLEPVRNFVMGADGVSIYAWLQKAIPGAAGTSGSFIDVNYYRPIIAIIQEAATGMADADALALYVSFNIFSAMIGLGLFVVVRLLLTIVTMIVKSYIPKKKSALNRLGGFFVGALRGLEWTLAITVAFSVIGGIPLVRDEVADRAQFLPLTVIEQVYAEGEIGDDPASPDDGEVPDPDDGETTDPTEPGEGEVTDPTDPTNPNQPGEGGGENPPLGDGDDNNGDNGDGSTEEKPIDPIALIEAEYEKSVFAKYFNIAAYAIKNACFLPKANAFDRLVAKSGYVVSDDDKQDPDDLFGDKLYIYCGLGNLNYTENVYGEDQITKLLTVVPEKDGFRVSTDGYSEYAFRDTVAAVMSFNESATGNADVFKGLIKEVEANQYSAYKEIIYEGSNSIRVLWRSALEKISAYDDAIANARLVEDPTATDVDSINNALETQYNEIVSLFNQISTNYAKIPAFGTLELGAFPQVFQLTVN